MIIGEIRRFLRDDHPIKVTRAIKEKSVQVKHARDRLGRKLGREPTVQRSLQNWVWKMRMLFWPLKQHNSLFPFSKLWGRMDRILTNSLITYPVLVKKKQGGWKALALRDALECLPVREQQIIIMRYFQDKTQSEIGEIMGLSQVQVSRLEHKAVAKLREYLLR